MRGGVSISQAARQAAPNRRILDQSASSDTVLPDSIFVGRGFQPRQEIGAQATHFSRCLSRGLLPLRPSFGPALVLAFLAAFAVWALSAFAHPQTKSQNAKPP